MQSLPFISQSLSVQNEDTEELYLHPTFSERISSNQVGTRNPPIVSFIARPASRAPGKPNQSLILQRSSNHQAERNNQIPNQEQQSWESIAAQRRKKDSFEQPPQKKKRCTSKLTRAAPSSPPAIPAKTNQRISPLQNHTLQVPTSPPIAVSNSSLVHLTDESFRHVDLIFKTKFQPLGSTDEARGRRKIPLQPAGHGRRHAVVGGKGKGGGKGEEKRFARDGRPAGQSRSQTFSSKSFQIIRGSALSGWTSCVDDPDIERRFV